LGKNEPEGSQVLGGSWGKYWGGDPRNHDGLFEGKNAPAIMSKFGNRDSGHKKTSKKKNLMMSIKTP